jgi:hypothetical protein
MDYKNIGMDKDELLRLKQITGLASLFNDKNFQMDLIKNSKDKICFDGKISHLLQRK